jgi:hypothetical protein
MLPHPTAEVKSGIEGGKTNEPDSFAPLRPPGWPGKVSTFIESNDMFYTCH